MHAGLLSPASTVNHNPAASGKLNRIGTIGLRSSGGNNMNISRRHLAGPLPVLGLVAFGMLGA
jgi:hypothetical protein